MGRISSTGCQSSCSRKFVGEADLSGLGVWCKGMCVLDVLSHDGMILGQLRGEKLEAAGGKRGKAVGHRVCARQPSRPGLGGCLRITVCQNLTFQNAPELTIGNLRGVWYKPGQYIVDIYAERNRRRKMKTHRSLPTVTPYFSAFDCF